MKPLFSVLYLFTSIFLSSCSDDGGSSQSTNQALFLAAKTPKVWQFISDQEMYSRDGATTGYLASINPNSKKLVIYLEGGGACFNAETCANNRSSFTTTQGEDYAGVLNNNEFGLIDRSNTSNIFSDWSYVFVPYSTGDVHIGKNDDADILNGPQDQQLVGYENFTQVVLDILNYYGSNGLTDILVCGSSAGGYGTYLNFIQVADQFPSANLSALVDAGPILVTDDYFNSCLGSAWKSLFEFDFPSDYNNTIQNTYSQPLQGIYEYLALTYPDAHFGLYSNLEDQVVRYFMEFGQNDCSGGDISGPQFAQALYTVKDTLDNYNNWSVYYAPGPSHTTLGLKNYNSLSVNGTTFKSWLDQLVTSGAPNVVP